ncbi:MAG: UvrD-helicase domain-containing protein [Patescibacteria group bacterium]|nr:UvrD-helicase domain-containing protein [Patescibacteria group bacterium]
MQPRITKLNNKQLMAVNHRQGPLLVVAGAGTGKTSVLVNRLAQILEQEKIQSDRVLLLTFTEKAAQEMEERADRLLPYGYLDLWINTFHSFCERLLREHALDIGLPADFRLLTSTEQWMVIKKNFDRFNLNYYRPLGNPTKFISELLKHFSRLKDENISSAEYLAYAKNVKNETIITDDKKVDADNEDDSDGNILESDRLQELAGAYATYNELLLENSWLDFGDLILYALKLLRERPNILKYYREKFMYVMVDEFQDTNWAQYELVKLLAAPNNNLMVVGDDDQAIYRFRGASLANIMQFKDDFPDAIEIILTDNYRSRQDILDTAHKFISHNNPNRLESKLHIDKTLIAKGESSERGQAPVFLLLERQDDELSLVADKILTIYKRDQAEGKDTDWSDFAILARSNDTASQFVKELTRHGIPNQFVSLRGLYYKSIILDCLAYLRLLDNYHESSALFRVLNLSPFRVSHSDVISLNRFARRKAWSLFETLQRAELVNDLSPEALPAIRRLLALIEKHSKLVANTLPSRLYFKFVEESGLLKDLDIDADQESFSYLNQFYQKVKRLEEGAPDTRLKDLMEMMNLELEAGETGSLRLDFVDQDSVKVMTVHAAKGLEFSYVFLVNLADKKFPTINRSEKIPLPEGLVKEVLVDSKDAHIEEERRLFYVALTRAKEELYITSAKDYGGAREKKASRFIEEAGLQSDVFNSGSINNELLRDLANEGADFLQAELSTDQLPKKFSFSQLAAYDNCPLQYKFAFILKIPAPEDKPSLIFGRVMHNIFYDFLKPAISGPQASLFSSEEDKNLFSLKRLESLLATHWVGDGYESSEQRNDYYKRAQTALKNFISAFNLKEGAHPKILFLEKNFSFKIGGETLKGAIDRVDSLEGGVEVIDYKTGRPKDKLLWKDRRQLILYQLFLEEVLQIKVLSLKYYYVEDGTFLAFTPKETEKEKLKLEINKQIQAIKSKDFTPKPSQMCKFCDFNRICEFNQS